MAKDQKHGNREARKPKKPVKPAAGAALLPKGLTSSFSGGGAKKKS